MLALLFIKATNGVVDAVTVLYFKEIAQQMADENDVLFHMTLKDLKDRIRCTFGLSMF